MKSLSEQQRQFREDIAKNIEQQQAFHEIEKTVLSYASENNLPANLPEITVNELAEEPDSVMVFNLKGEVQDGI